jgi:hypothetical protein
VRAADAQRSMPSDFFGSFPMANVANQDRHITGGALIATARFVTWAAPITLWLVHIFVILPRLAQQSGEAKFIQAFGFFIVSGPIMIGCFILSLVVYFKGRSRYDVIPLLIPLLLNLSWLYYVKVIVYGPTIGNL